MKVWSLLHLPLKGGGRPAPAGREGVTALPHMLRRRHPTPDRLRRSDPPPAGEGDRTRFSCPQAGEGIARGFAVLRFACIALFALTFLALLASSAQAEKGKLRERLTPDVMAVVYPGAERLGPEEGSPPAIAVYKGDKPVAYIFSTLDIIAAPGYSVTPFDVIAGVDLDGRITGAKVVFHREPYIYHDAVRQPLLDTFLAREAGMPLRGGATMLRPEFVAGATISARAMRAAILDTARLVLRTRVSHAAVTAPTLDTESFQLMTWNELVAEGAVARLRLTSGDVAAALARAGASDAVLDVRLGKPNDLYIEVMTGL